MNPNKVGCDNPNEYTGIRCGMDIIIELDDGTAYCRYCYTDYVDEDIVHAVNIFKRAGMA